MDANDILMYLGALLALSEALSLIPAVKANGIFQMIYNLLKALAPKDKELK